MDLEPRGNVGQVAVPPAARALTGLARIDYEDAFRLELASASDRTAEQWARAALEDAPESTRRALRAVWAALGIQLGPADSGQRVLGWEVRRSTSDAVLLGAPSRLGLTGEIACLREPCAILVATFVRLDNPLARVTWAAVAPGHRRVVPRLLEQASRRIKERPKPAPATPGPARTPTAPARR